MRNALPPKRAFGILDDDDLRNWTTIRGPPRASRSLSTARLLRLPSGGAPFYGALTTPFLSSVAQRAA